MNGHPVDGQCPFYLVVELRDGARAPEPGLARDAQVAGEEIVEGGPQGDSLPFVLHQLVDGGEGLGLKYRVTH